MIWRIGKQIMSHIEILTLLSKKLMVEFTPDIYHMMMLAIIQFELNVNKHCCQQDSTDKGENWSIFGENEFIQVGGHNNVNIGVNPPTLLLVLISANDSLDQISTLSFVKGHWPCIKRNTILLLSSILSYRYVSNSWWYQL